MYNKKGIATVGTVLSIFLAGIVGGSAGSVAIDSYADQQPDSVLYGLERFGESIKQPVVTDLPKNIGPLENVGKSESEWYVDRAKERTEEFEKMVEKEKTEEHLNLVNQAQNNISNAVQTARNKRELERARKQVEKHIQVLQNVENKVPENARPGIRNAIKNSSRVRNRLREVSQNVENKPSQKLPSNARKNLENLSNDLRVNLPAPIRER